jgi:alkanesulfonate monooxygenase SsuD/methylene tetrahydromethanopterin reductase-like flavin-dependent oxidoreductase (luciferase family)
MDLGTGLFTAQRSPGDDRSMTAIYDEILELGRAIDRAGLASAWVSEHHFAADGYLPGTMPTLAALAAVTESVELGTGIALAPLYDSIRLAEDAATVSLLSNDRLSLGLAVGYREAEFEAFGIPLEERGARTEAVVEVCRGAWSDGPLGFDPEFHPAGPHVDVTPTPDGSPRIVLGGAAKPAVRRAARLADGWMAPSSLSVEGIRKRVEDIRSVRAEAGMDGECTMYVIKHGFLGDSPADAWERMRAGRLYLARTYASWFEGEPVEELSEERRQELHESAIVGTPDQVVEQLEPYRRAVGEDVHVILRTYHPGIGTEAMVDCIERLGDEVVPRL